MEQTISSKKWAAGRSMFEHILVPSIYVVSYTRRRVYKNGRFTGYFTNIPIKKDWRAASAKLSNARTPLTLRTPG